MKKSRISYLIALLWVIAIGGLLYNFLQMRSYANIINNAGVVRGGTQRAVKLELCHTPDDDIIARVDGLLQQLQKDEENRVIKGKPTETFVDNLAAVKDKWLEIKEQIALVRAGGDGQKLLQLSEEHFRLADTAVYSAQVRAEDEFKYSMIITVILFGMASVSIVAS